MRKVLIVDDSAFMRMVIKTLLLKNGFEEIEEAQNGIEALQNYKELKPDIVTMDITMPEMNGLEALKSIKEFDSDAKVVMISSVGQEEMVTKAMMYGAKSFIMKPFKEDQVINTLNRLLEL